MKTLSHEVPKNFFSQAKPYVFVSIIAKNTSQGRHQIGPFLASDSMSSWQPWSHSLRNILPPLKLSIKLYMSLIPGVFQG